MTDSTNPSTPTHPNQTHPGFKLTSLGWIPEEWEVVKLGDIMNFLNGYAFKPSDWKKRGLPIIRIQNLNDADATFNYYDGKLEARYLVKDGDLLFAWSGTKGVSFGARIWNGGNACLNQHIFKVVLKRVAEEYGFFLLRGAQEAVEKSAHGFKSSFVHVTKGYLENTRVVLPPLPEQRKIAAVLGAWDAAIEKTGQLLTALRQRHRALQQQLLTGQTRFPEFQGEAWPLVEIGSVASEANKRNRTDKSLTVLSCTKYDGLVASLDYFGRKVYSDDLSTYKVVSKGTFVYATNHIEEGSIGYQSTYEEALISPMYTVFVTNGSIDDNFLYDTLKTEKYIQIYKRNMSGSTDRRGGLRWDDFSKIKIPFPSLA